MRNIMLLALLLATMSDVAVGLAPQVTKFGAPKSSKSGANAHNQFPHMIPVMRQPVYEILPAPPVAQWQAPWPDLNQLAAPPAVLPTQTVVSSPEVMPTQIVEPSLPAPPSPPVVIGPPGPPGNPGPPGGPPPYWQNYQYPYGPGYASSWSYSSPVYGRPLPYSRWFPRQPPVNINIFSEQSTTAAPSPSTSIVYVMPPVHRHKPNHKPNYNHRRHPNRPFAKVAFRDDKMPKEPQPKESQDLTSQNLTSVVTPGAPLVRTMRIKRTQRPWYWPNTLPFPVPTPLGNFYPKGSPIAPPLEVKAD